MITWTCKTAAAALALTFLAACEEGQGSPFTGNTSPRSVALSQAKMAAGALTIVPPSGFCIDKTSLKPRFALMARCDVLGAPSAAGAAPVGLIMVSVSPGTAGGTVPSPTDTARALDLVQVSDQVISGDSVTFRARGPAPVEGMDDTHWRATALIGSHVVGLALFGPANGRAVSSEGRSMLSQVIAQSSAGS